MNELNQINLQGRTLPIDKALKLCERMAKEAKEAIAQRCPDCRDTRYVDTPKGVKRCERCRADVKAQRPQTASVLSEL